MRRPGFHPWSMALAVALAFPLWLVLDFVRLHRRHFRWYQSVEYRIACLGGRKPAGIDSKQWAACVHWTWQLHTNYGGIGDSREDARGRFLGQLDEKLKGDVDLSTIDWFWDNYPARAGAASYSDDYRPTTPDRLREASLDRLNEWNFDLVAASLRDYVSARGISPPPGDVPCPSPASASGR